MIYFPRRLIFPYLVSWIVAQTKSLVQRGWVALTPPFSPFQLLINLRTFAVHRIRISSWNDWATIAEIFLRREYDLSRLSAFDDVRKNYQQILDSGNPPLILDLGSNIGISALFFKDSWPDSNVICVEPAASNFALLSHNTKNMSGVTTFLAGVSHVSGKLKVLDLGTGNSGFRTFGNEGSQLSTVPAKTITELISGDLGVPFLCKIDIEGAEKFLFEGDTSWIELFKVIAIEIHDWMLPGEAVSKGFLSAITNQNRDLVISGENLLSIRVD
jgi:FkbM family methyltransferase